MKTTHFALKHNFILLSFLLSAFLLSAQDRELGLELLEEESFFFSGISPSVLVRGKAEVNFYSSLFSTWLAVHESFIESPVRDRLRLSEFLTNAEIYYGVSISGRWDLGARFRYARRRLDNSAQSSPFKVFKTEESEAANMIVDKTYSGLREIGVRLRVVPFESVPALTLNAGYSFSPVKSEEDQKNLVADRNSFDLNIAYYVGLNNNAYYYFIANGTAFHPSAVNEEWLYSTTGSFFIVQMLANRKLAIYPGLSYTIAFKPPFNTSSDYSLVKTNEQVLGILGVQFQPFNSLSLNVSGAIPLILENSNLLIRQVKESYSFVSVGGRFLF